MNVRLFSIFSLFLVWGLSAEPKYGDKGCLELAGSASTGFLAMQSGAFLQTSWTPQGFPADMFFTGMTMGLQLGGGGGYSSSALLAGIIYGFAYNKIIPVVFLSTGITGILGTVSIDGFGSGAAGGFQLPVTVGIKIPINNSFLITPQVTYAYTKIEKTAMSTLAFGIGLSGFKFAKSRVETATP